MASTTALSLPAAEPQKCCADCSQPRTLSEFQRNHVKTHIAVPDDESCCICREDYRDETWNFAFGRPDVPCQIVGIEGCNHIIGWGCLTSILYSSEADNCPLCRTQWFSRTCLDPDAQVEASALEAHKHDSANQVMRQYMVDYATARFYQFGEPEYRDRASPLRLSMLSAYMRRMEQVSRAVASEWVQDAVTKLQDSTPSPIDPRLYNPFHGTQEVFLYDDPFTFRNWFVNDLVLELVIADALNSENGRRARVAPSYIDGDLC